ncbi:MAG: hypothetical protein PXY39_13305 [archaeon]|nr:hypothetical protein [archaeon]
MPNGNKKHRTLLVSITLGVAIILRLYPTLFHGAPWGTDGWPLLKDTQELLSNTPTMLAGNSATFADQYNVYWPGSIVFGAVSSLIFNLLPIEIMPIVIPIVAALSTLILFVIVEKLTGSTIAAFIGSLIFTTSSFDAIFTASVTKETFAYPLFMVGILLLAFSIKQFSFRNLGLFFVVSLALVMAHYALALILATITGSVLIAQLVVSFSRSSRASFDFRLLIMPISILAVIGSYLVYAFPGFEIPVNLSDILSLSSFVILSIAVSLYFTLSKEIPIRLPALILAVALAFLTLSTLVPIVPFQPVIPPSIVFDAIPYLFVGLLALFGYELSHRLLSKDQFSFLAVWIAIPLGLFGFSVFGTPDGLGFIYRLFTFIYAPAAVFAGVSLASFVEKNETAKLATLTNFSTLKKSAVVLVILIIAILCSYQTYAAVAQGQNLLGGQWGYTPSDISSAAFTKSSTIQNMSVSGDSKILYLYDQYYGVNVSVAKGYQILLQGTTNESNTPLVTDEIMLLDGYNIQLYGNPLPLNWSNNLFQHSSLIYTNGNDEIWY